MSPDPLSEATEETLRTLIRLMGTVLGLVLVAISIGSFVAYRNATRAQDAADDAKHAVEAARATQVTLRQFEMESRARRDATCRIQEEEQRREVVRLIRTYEFLPQLLAQDPNSILSKAAIRSLPELESDARRDNAPPYCDEQGFGQPETGPRGELKVPERPQSLRGLR